MKVKKVFSIFPTEKSQNEIDENLLISRIESYSSAMESLSEMVLKVSDSLIKSGSHDANLIKDARVAQMRNLSAMQLLNMSEMLKKITVFSDDELENDKISFEVDDGVFQIAKDESSLCGDYYDSFFSKSGKYIMIISDGMGTGPRAALDSAMAVEMLTTLLKADIDFECAIKMVNCALIIKSPFESVATIDVVSINLKSGKADFYKAGAAATLVRHGRRVSKLEKPSLPLGILNQIDFSHSHALLSPGDIILMSSDGVWISDTVWIAKQLSYFKNGSMDDLAKTVAQKALKESGEYTDDITVMTAELMKAS